MRAWHSVAVAVGCGIWSSASAETHAGGIFERCLEVTTPATIAFKAGELVHLKNNCAEPVDAVHGLLGGSWAPYTLHLQVNEEKSTGVLVSAGQLSIAGCRPGFRPVLADGGDWRPGERYLCSDGRDRADPTAGRTSAADAQRETEQRAQQEREEAARRQRAEEQARLEAQQKLEREQAEAERARVEREQEEERRKQAELERQKSQEQRRKDEVKAQAEAAAARQAARQAEGDLARANIDAVNARFDEQRRQQQASYDAMAGAVNGATPAIAEGLANLAMVELPKHRPEGEFSLTAGFGVGFMRLPKNNVSEDQMLAAADLSLRRTFWLGDDRQERTVGFMLALNGRGEFGGPLFGAGKHDASFLHGRAGGLAALCLGPVSLGVVADVQALSATVFFPGSAKGAPYAGSATSGGLWFGLHPLDLHNNRLVLSASWLPLGEGLSSGTVMLEAGSGRMNMVVRATHYELAVAPDVSGAPLAGQSSGIAVSVSLGLRAPWEVAP